MFKKVKIFLESGHERQLADIVLAHRGMVLSISVLAILVLYGLPIYTVITDTQSGNASFCQAGIVRFCSS